MLRQSKTLAPPLEKIQRSARDRERPTVDLMTRIGDGLNKKIYLLLILPSLFFYTVFWIVPMLMAIGISFLEWDGISVNTMQWIGFDNYVELFHDPFFWTSLQNNIIFVCGAVIIQCLLALGFAIALDAGVKGSQFLRTTFFMPTVFSMIVVGLLFTLVLSPSFGLLGTLFSMAALDSLRDVQWLGDSRTALYAVLAVYIWKHFGFSMFLFLAGLQAISQELIDAARIDGAGPWQVLRHITLPMLREVTIVVVALAVIGALQVFDLIYVMTGGGPYHASDVLATYMYTEAFSAGRMGYGTAIAEVLFIITFVVTAVYLYVTRVRTDSAPQPTSLGR